MVKPTIRGTGCNLKTSGTSHIWLAGDDINLGDKVEVSIGGVVEWTGDIQKKKAEKYRADVKPVRKEEFGDGDLEDVVITVTNSGNETDQHDDEVVIDAP